MDPYALKAWCWEVLARANTMPLPTAYKSGTVDLEFLLKVAKLSWSEEGPRLAQEFLGGCPRITPNASLGYVESCGSCVMPSVASTLSGKRPLTPTRMAP